MVDAEDYLDSRFEGAAAAEVVEDWTLAHFLQLSEEEEFRRKRTLGFTKAGSGLNTSSSLPT